MLCISYTMTRPFCKILLKDCEDSSFYDRMDHCVLCIGERQIKELQKIKDRLTLIEIRLDERVRRSDNNPG